MSAYVWLNFVVVQCIGFSYPLCQFNIKQKSHYVFIQMFVWFDSTLSPTRPSAVPASSKPVFMDTESVAADVSELNARAVGSLAGD